MENVPPGSFEVAFGKRSEGTKNEKTDSPEDPFRVIGSPSNRKSNTEVIRLPGKRPHTITVLPEKGPAAGRMRN